MFYYNNYNKKYLKNNKYLYLPKYLKSYGSIFFLLFFFQKIDNLLFIKEMKRFVNSVNISYFNVVFENISVINKE
jgi:hypothetical protein